MDVGIDEGRSDERTVEVDHLGIGVQRPPHGVLAHPADGPAGDGQRRRAGCGRAVHRPTGQESGAHGG